MSCVHLVLWQRVAEMHSSDDISFANQVQSAHPVLAKHDSQSVVELSYVIRTVGSCEDGSYLYLINFANETGTRAITGSPFRSAAQYQTLCRVCHEVKLCCFHSLN